MKQLMRGFVRLVCMVLIMSVPFGLLWGGCQALDKSYNNIPFGWYEITCIITLTVLILGLIMYSMGEDSK